MIGALYYDQEKQIGETTTAAAVVVAVVAINFHRICHFQSNGPKGVSFPGKEELKNIFSTLGMYFEMLLPT